MIIAFLGFMCLMGVFIYSLQAIISGSRKIVDLDLYFLPNWLSWIIRFIITLSWCILGTLWLMFLALVFAVLYLPSSDDK
jgi:hypothetical protein